MSYTTNQEIIEAVTELVSPETQSVFRTAMENGQDLSSFNSIPTPAMNEFLGAFINKFALQLGVDPLKFESPFSRFEITNPSMGETIELNATHLPEVGVYSEDSTLLDVIKPKVSVKYLSTRDKIKIQLTRSEQILRAAFTKEGGLAAFLATITKVMFDSRNLFLYNAIKTDLYNGVTVEHELTSKGLTDSDAKEVYQEILNLAYDMQLPSEDYNPSGMMATTQKGILVINTASSASFDVNVFASLFNSSSIDTSKVFTDVIRIKDTDHPELVGYILSEDSYIWNNRILELRDSYDSSNMMTNFYIHNWINRGVNPLVNSVKLVISTEE